MTELTRVIQESRSRRASDIHIVKGLPIRIRIDGALQDYDDHILTAEDCEAYAREMAGDEFKQIETIGELDLAITFDGGIRCRINIFRMRGWFSSAIRILSDKIPNLDDLGLPPAVQKFPELNRGIVLVTGETGSGKSTTLAALLDRINHTHNDHIVTLEDPIEYIYTPDKCTINQREIGTDTVSYESGLRAILREAPDVILIGEMRDLNTIETALTAAETGHLVFATLHTNSAAESIDRMVDVFPEGRQRQIRLQLSTALMAVLSQQLLPKKNGGRVCACELMIVTPAIRNLIREGKTPQIASALSTSASEGSITMDNALLQLYRARTITADVARGAARDAEFVRKNTLY
mgnify:CR=1 FL=1